VDCEGTVTPIAQDSTSNRGIIELNEFGDTLIMPVYLVPHPANLTIEV
jgi:hypothetical protein